MNADQRFHTIGMPLTRDGPHVIVAVITLQKGNKKRDHKLLPQDKNQRSPHELRVIKQTADTSVVCPQTTLDCPKLLPEVPAVVGSLPFIPRSILVNLQMLLHVPETTPILLTRLLEAGVGGGGVKDSL